MKAFLREIRKRICWLIFGRIPDCFDHADNCCAEWCSRCATALHARRLGL